MYLSNLRFSSSVVGNPGAALGHDDLYEDVACPLDSQPSTLTSDDDDDDRPAFTGAPFREGIEVPLRRRLPC